MRQCARRKLGVADQAREPAFLQMARREIAQQHGDLPVLHQLVGQTGIAARDLFGDDREGLHFARRIELHAAEFFRDAESADADAVGRLEDLARQALVRLHQPLALPVGADEWDDIVVHKSAAALPHQPLLFRQPAINHVHDLFLLWSTVGV